MDTYQRLPVTFTVISMLFCAFACSRHGARSSFEPQSPLTPCPKSESLGLLYSVSIAPDEVTPLAGYPVDGHRYLGMKWSHRPWETTVVAEKVPGFEEPLFFAGSPMPAESEEVDVPNTAPLFFLGPYDGAASDVSMTCHSNWCKGELGAAALDTWHLVLDITRKEAPWLELYVKYTDATMKVQLRAACQEGPVVVAEGLLLR